MPAGGDRGVPQPRRRRLTCAATSTRHPGGAATFEAGARWLIETDSGERLCTVLRDGYRLLVGSDDADVSGRSRSRGRSSDQPLAPRRRRLHRPPGRLIGTGCRCAATSESRATPRIRHQRTATYSFPAFRGMIDQQLQEAQTSETSAPSAQAFAGLPVSAALGPARPPERKILDTPWRNNSRSSTSWVSGARGPMSGRSDRTGGCELFRR